MPNIAKTPATLSRRSALMATAAVGTTAALSTGTASAASRMKSAVPSAAVTPGRGAYAVGAQHATSLPDTVTRHLLSRFTSGVTSARVAEVAAAGGPDAWFTQQLNPAAIPDRKASDLWGWWPTLALTPLQRYARYKNGVQTGWEQMQDFASWVMMRRLITNRQVEEMMVDFWSNLLHVASPDSESWVWRVEYAALIRKNALGRFDTLLHEAVVHPSMGLYLNNVESTATAINENLGRELLECHTVGVDGGYTENDVINSARILTGFHVDERASWEATYIPANHWAGRVKVMGFSSPNAKADGRPVLNKYLTYLSHHPATAKRLCRALAVRFVSDNPSDALIASLATVYQDSDTDIKPVLLAMIASDEFRNAGMQKVRTPVEDALATWTAVGAVVAQPHDIHDAGNQFINVSKAIGQVVYDWPTPDAFPDIGPAWTGSGRVLGSMRTHWYAASGSWPNMGISFPAPIDWMPQLPTTFDKVVAYVVSKTLFVPMTSTMLQAACVATDIKQTDMIDGTHSLITIRFPRLLVSLLDTPEHLSR